ncbi:mannosyl-glycoprotein endo-beta-N-acetylglucosamidase [Fructilactobacillus lindneri]|uniref:Exoglucosaminidase n=2 Tax=Fructilactobacillus lindneri TaxID=53444 RepID=A0A0R2JSL1_9LACO|nr:glucosaminidase domain-containing protein [Fructilactobacillus lindneri]ANZ57451.1 mannosyl-glycoprotein endo-beta-N-acetylglucosamidase [Fructilactobacillus lindneri]ANZ58719.1 mannosyl-glycoprotein endo-beta-N-acetylglucosamidase [Fructilactobacillus lindneri]KRN80062.1 exoglucosaminidase [Fructilactobacillus lindneri DSM 20690 = JCM 11027]POG97937.1 mannosyl-glycoprotein endo-beta-N-acetylglucosamidase [Fructilactobacillus lindneri]POG99269.1 mannosyl-glycoprotein endo-beta-N-acetylgluco
MKNKNKRNDGKSIWYPIIAFLIVAGFILLLFGTYKVRKYMNEQTLIKNEKKFNEENNPTIKQHNKFIKQVATPSIEQYKKNHQVLPSIVIAQAILESNWGKSKLYQKAKNPFGIKGTYQGASISYETGEYINHKHVTQVCQFRKYPDLQAAIEDHNQALFDKFLKKDNITSYREEAELLQKNTYATDPDYADKLIKVIKTHDLQKYDKQAINN